MQTHEGKKDTEAERILQEYQDFAYIVSHDLSAPIRHIREFTKLLIGVRQDALSEEEREYMRHLENSFASIDNMQQGLLSFSRVNTVYQASEAINTTELIDNVINSLEGEILEYNPNITYDNLPDVFGDPTQIYTLFLNIIQNAIKFHEPETSRQISIKSTEDQDSVTFTIEDNGIGIEEAFLTEIFRMFRRLHASGVYQGNGVGLTLAKKIIERHGGKIEVQSKPGECTKVIFTLPKR